MRACTAFLARVAAARSLRTRSFLSQGSSAGPLVCREAMADQHFLHAAAFFWRVTECDIFSPTSGGRNVGNVHTSNALLLYSCASFCKTLADIVVRFVTGRYRLIFRLEEHVSHTTLRVLYEIRVGWSDKASPAERDYRVGLRDTGHVGELRPAL